MWVYTHIFSEAAYCTLREMTRCAPCFILAVTVSTVSIISTIGCESAATDAAKTPTSNEPDAAMATLPDAFAPKSDASAPADSGNEASAQANFCSGQKLCDTFESYAPGALANGATIGPWQANVGQGNGSASIDASRAYTGARSLKVHINPGLAGGGQLRTKSNLVFAPAAPKLYGKFRMYLEPGAGTSNHWTMFGSAGTVQPGVPIAGNHVTYLFSAFNDNGKNRFGNVFYNDQTQQDCWHNSTQPIPTGRWACIGFSVDGPKIEYRAFLDGQSVQSLSVNTTGDGCLNAAANAPWYGPSFDEFYVGALSFHPMSAPLDLWIDDVVLDTNPVTCE
jgi:hypothetical protein